MGSVAQTSNPTPARLGLVLRQDGRDPEEDAVYEG